jgi:hypothetical protein
VKRALQRTKTIRGGFRDTYKSVISEIYIQIIKKYQ